MMKKVVLMLIALAVFASTAYAQSCKCDNRHAIMWAQSQIYYGGDSSDFQDYLNYLTEGEDLLGKGKYWEAIEKFKKAIEIESCLPEPYAQIGWCYRKLLYKNQAMEYYRQACDRIRCNEMPDTYKWCDKYGDLRKELLGY